MGASTAAAAASGMPGGSACSTSWGSRWSPAHKIDREDNAKQVVEWVGWGRACLRHRLRVQLVSCRARNTLQPHAKLGGSEG